MLLIIRMACYFASFILLFIHKTAANGKCSLKVYKLTLLQFAALLDYSQALTIAAKYTEQVAVTHSHHHSNAVLYVMLFFGFMLI